MLYGRYEYAGCLTAPLVRSVSTLLGRRTRDRTTVARLQFNSIQFNSNFTGSSTTTVNYACFVRGYWAGVAGLR